MIKLVPGQPHMVTSFELVLSCVEFCRIYCGCVTLQNIPSLVMLFQMPVHTPIVGMICLISPRNLSRSLYIKGNERLKFKQEHCVGEVNYNGKSSLLLMVQITWIGSMAKFCLRAGDMWDSSREYWFMWSSWEATLWVDLLRTWPAVLSVSCLSHIGSPI